MFLFIIIYLITTVSKKMCYSRADYGASASCDFTIPQELKVWITNVLSLFMIPELHVLMFFVMA